MEVRVQLDPPDRARTAADDQAESRALLDRATAAVRIWRPARAVAFSRLDDLRDGAGDARRLAAEAGFEPVSRVSGGHAVVLGNGSLCVGIAEPAATFQGTQDRYERLTAAVIAALQAVGVDAERGELPGEWCPGAWSVRSGGVKLAGLAQRAIKGAAWAEAVIDFEPDPEARALLPPIYDALELPLDAKTVGSVSELTGRSIRFDDFAESLLSGLLTS